VCDPKLRPPVHELEWVLLRATWRRAAAWPFRRLIAGLNNRRGGYRPAAGAASFFHKPIDSDALLAVIKDILDGKTPAREPVGAPVVQAAG